MTDIEEREAQKNEAALAIYTIICGNLRILSTLEPFKSMTGPEALIKVAESMMEVAEERTR